MEEQKPPPEKDAVEHILARKDKSSLRHRFIDHFKGKGLANSQLDVRDGSPQEMMESVTLQPDDASCSKQDESALITDEHSSDEEYLPNEDIQEPKEPTFARKNYCYVCGKGMTKLTRHFLRHADEETEIAGAFALPIYSKERKRLFEDLRNRGNYKHNQEVLRNNSGELKLKRRPSKANVSAKAFALCLHCKGLYKRRDLSRHVERCHSRKRSCPVNSTSTIPFTRDVQDFYRYLETTSASAIKTLKMYENPQVYNVLSKLTLAQLTVLNKGAPEVSKMSLKSFQERDDSTRVLSKHFIRINVVSKNRLKVAVLLTPELVSAITLLVDKRQNCGVHEDNPFLFAKPDRTDSSVYSGVHCIRSFSNLCEAKNPEHLRLVHLHKHIARVFQILNLENNELDHLAKLLGRDIRADRDYYRLPGAAVELAKIAKLLLAMEKGALEKFKGISLDEMEIEDELEPDVEMCKPKDSDTEEDSDESDVPPLQNENVKRPCRKRTPEKDALEHIKTRRDKPFLQEMLIDTIKGKGVFTHQSIEPSSFVVEYRGNISTRTETRGKERGDTLNNYLFDFSWNGTNWRVDASKSHGGFGRLVNDDHVSPNCEMKKIVFEEKPHLCLFAVKEIHRGEEITYDYGDSSYPWRSTTTSEELNSTQTHLKDAASSPEDEMVVDFEAFSSEESCGDDEYVPGPDEEPSSVEYDNEVKDDDEQKNNPDVVDSSEQQPTDDSPVQQEDDSNDHPPERDAINLSPANKNYCYVCGKPQSKISRHLLTHRHEEADIAQVFALRRNSKERKKQMDDLRKRGNYKHNQEVLKTCCGELKVSKRSKVSLTNSNLFAPCLYCKGMYSRKLMWRHVRKCSNKLFKGAIGPKTKVLTLVATTVSTEPREMTSYVRDVLKNLNNDEISSAVREDCYLLRLAQCLCFTNKTKKQSEYIRRKLREMGRVLLRLRKKSISCFEDAVKPENFSKVVEAVKELSGFREETQSCDRPTFAQKLGETLKKIGDISYAVALKEDADKETIHQAETFMRLCAEEWGPRSKSFIKNPSTILFTQDAQLLYQCIEKTAASAVQSLTMYESPPVYNALLRVTLAQAAILNANVFKKVPRVTLKSFQERDDAELHTDASVGRSQLEQILCKRFVTINVMSKAERKGHDKEIALMLTPELLSAITLLVSKRESCGVHALNSFLFARPVAIRTSFYQGQTCISLFVARCGAKNLETQRPALFRKHMVRTYQILSLTNDELDQLAKLLARDIQTDRDYYQKPEAAGDIAKISELLSEMENGSVERFEGKSFEDIEIPDELQPDLKECDSDNNDANEDCEDAESSVLSRDSSPQKRVSSSKKRGRRKRKKSESEESVQDEEEHDEGDAESDDQSEEVPAKCAEETPSRGNEEATNVSFSDEDMNVDFDMDEDTDDDVRNDNRDGDVGSDGSAAMPPRTQVKGRTEQDEDVSDNKKERSPHKNSTDTDPEETMDVDAEETDKVTGGEGADGREVDTSGSSAALNTEKKKRLLAQMNGMKKVKVLIPKLDINLQNPVHISQLPPAFKKWLEKDQPLQDDDNEPETSSSSTDAKNHPTTEEATYMTCSHCEKSMMKGQTAYQKKGFTHVFCSKSCLFEKFPVNKPDTKTCHSCHKAITQPLDLVMAVVDAQGTVKDFCALTCLCLFKSVHAPAQTPQSLCSMCNKSCAATCELSLTQAVHKFCNKSCLDGFCRDNMPACDNCSSHCRKQPLMLELEEDGTKTICSEECLTEFKEKTETPQPCSMCLTSQQMSDMVNYKSIEGTVKLFCNRGCMVSYQLKPAAQENKRKAWLKKKKKGQQTKQKPNTEGVSVDSGSTAEEPTLISAASCVSCRTCETRMMKGQTVYQLKSSSDVFCSASCFTQMNPHIKVVTKHCHNCFQVILQPLKVILAPVGDVGTMKELCGETCLASVNSRMSTAVLKTQPQVGYHKVNNLTAPQCDICASTCTDDQFLLKMEDSRVCSKECLVKFKEKVKTPQMCPMCQTSHQLSDMVEDKDQDGRLDFFCSNRCSVVYKAQFLTQSAKTSSSSEERNIKDVTPKDVKPKLDFIKQEPVDEGYNHITTRRESTAKTASSAVMYAKCDTCSHKGKLRESLSMLGEVKHFCDLRCVLHFCNKRLQVVNTDSSSPESAGAAASSPIITSVISLSSTTQHASSSPESSRQAESSPVITSVVSLASHLARRNKTSSSTTQHESVPEIQTKVVGHASVQTAPRELKNKSVLCSPLVHNKGVSCTTATVDAEAQTDNFVPQVIVLPLPVPAYVPLPMNMYSQYTPQPVGLPVPLPVPIFLPVALDRPDPATKERVEPPEADLHLRSETGTQQDDRSGRENGLRAEELTTEDERQETQDLNEHTSSFDDDLDKNDLGSFNLQEHSFTDVSLWSPGQPHTPAPPPIREEPASSAPAPPPSQQTLLSKVHNKNEGPKLPQLCKATKEETFQRDLSKLMSRKQHKQKSQCGIDAWKRWIQGRKSQTNLDPVSFKENVLLCSAAELSDGLCCFVNEVKQADGEPHPPDSLFYLCLSIQQFLFENDRMENIFSDVIYSQFTTEFTKILKRLKPSVTAAGYVQSCVEEEFLWECKQLGAYSPIVLLNTLLFFCCKNFGFTTVEQHRQLSFTQLTCCTRTNLNHTRTTSLRFYPPISTTEALPDGVPAKKRKKGNVENSLEMMENPENPENPLHCPVRLCEFYLSKCSESVKQRSDWFFLWSRSLLCSQQPPLVLLFPTGWRHHGGHARSNPHSPRAAGQKVAELRPNGQQTTPRSHVFVKVVKDILSDGNCKEETSSSRLPVLTQFTSLQSLHIHVLFLVSFQSVECQHFQL
ncbi:uncharacterized protein LOC117770910 isoform X12 [Hippoglossus hippoglossus]|uniref:uncharacterized protein LOC117770910 isoform X12 n=1 Tax=Hippoglossus hippoglossus TaxID=8267 RepID=UPI00148E6361|nr:uncharacterized protein LOC117770910 isoform X12 [Hippoglossus hippoglossus]